MCLSDLVEYNKNPMNITASILYNYTQCPHRVWRDIHGPQEEKMQEVNPFVQLLWDKGVQFEREVVRQTGEFVDVSEGDIGERNLRTMDAMREGKELIYQGVITHGKLLGIPDFLKKLADGNYMPVEIKAGKAYQNGGEDDEGKPKKHYAVQLCLYVEILKSLGFAKENKGAIIDIEMNETPYMLDKRMGERTQKTWWEYYEQVKAEAMALVENEKQNYPANSAVCKLCPWSVSCKKWCDETGDLTNLFYLGRNTRDIIRADLGILTMEDLCSLDIDKAMGLKGRDKRILKGVGEGLLRKLIARADVTVNRKKPVLYGQLDLPKVPIELFFDIESDPTQDLVYLHGVYERRAGEERFIYFLAKDKQAEKDAWQGFWDYVMKLGEGNYAIYYYSPYEKTTYKKMSRKYPDVVSEDEVAEFFASSNAIDLYGIVQAKTDWPLSSYSIKDIATYLGFKWRDENPSGALSIQWYNEYIASKDGNILKRIIEYNEDDCKAMIILKDKLAEYSELMEYE